MARHGALSICPVSCEQKLLCAERAGITGESPGNQLVEIEVPREARTTGVGETEIPRVYLVGSNGAMHKGGFLSDIGRGWPESP